MVCTCGRVHVSAFPADISETVQYGPNVRALAVHLTQGQMLPYARAAELIQDLYGLTVSPATLLAWVGEARVALQSTADQIAELLRRGALINADESGLRAASRTSCGWVGFMPNWMASSPHGVGVYDVGQSGCAAGGWSWISARK